MQANGTRIRILHLISTLEVGGAEKLLTEWMKVHPPAEVQAIDYTVVVMNRQVNPNLRQELERANCRVYYLHREEREQHPVYLLKLLSILRQEEIQIIHTHNSGAAVWAALCKLAFPYLKLVCTVHGTHNVANWNWLLRLIYRHWMNANIAISRAVQEEMLARRIPCRQQIYNGIPVRFFEMPTRAHRPEAPLRIVHVGRMDYSIKGQDILLRALEHCKEHDLHVHCKLIGGVYAYSERSYQELRQLVRELDLEQEVEFVTNQSSVEEFLKEADLFVLPSRHEGLGFAILEAMAARVPVIASNIEGPRELIRHGETGYLFKVGDDQALFQAIHQVYERPEQVSPWVEAAYRFVQDFDIVRMKAHYEQLYDALCTQPWAWLPRLQWQC